MKKHFYLLKLDTDNSGARYFVHESDTEHLPSFDIHYFTNLVKDLEYTDLTVSETTEIQVYEFDRI